MSTRPLIATTVAAFSLLLGALAVAAPAVGPMAQTKQATDQILEVLEDPALQGDDKAKERREKILDVVDGLFDWPGISQRALARHWHGRTEAERQEFVTLFAELVRRTYLKKLEGYSGEKVAYKDERIDGDYARVYVDVITAKNTEVPVIYSMMAIDGKWVVYDVAIEGVRLVNNYRTQFNNVLSGMSFREFLAKLRKKVEKLRKE
jgi:phospholipid transport system substrate-binding protein